MTISVIVPLYNKAATIERALSSIRMQTLPVDEILVIDDGSTDDGVGRVLALQDPTVRVVSQTNSGPAAARNAGLAMATGTFVAFLDADDEWDANFTAVTLAQIKNPDLQLAFVAASYRETAPGQRDVRNQDTLGLGGAYIIGPETTVELLDRLETFVAMQFTLMRTEMARSLGGYFDRTRCHLGEDAYFAMKIIMNERFAVIPVPLGTYHREDSDLHGGGLTTSPALLPYFTHFDELLASVPPESRGLLSDFIGYRAVRAAQMYAKLGERSTARYLATNFRRPNRRTTDVLRTELAIALSPALPTVRRLRRNLLAVLRHRGDAR